MGGQFSSISEDSIRSNTRPNSAKYCAGRPLLILAYFATVLGMTTTAGPVPATDINNAAERYAHLPICPKQLSAEQIAQLKSDGYLAFRDVLSPQEVTQSIEAMTDMARRAITDRDNFEIKGNKHGGNYRGAYFQSRHSNYFAQLEPEASIDDLSPEEIELLIRKFANFTQEVEFFDQMAQAHPRVQGVVQSILGANPLLFQDMALVKPPFIGVAKPWHQDNAYFAVSPLESVIGVWIALEEALPENGCMHVIPGGHKDGAFRHTHIDDCEIEAKDLDLSRVRPVPVPAGGALFFYGMLPHETPPNRSPHRRRALQFHYRAASSEIVDDEVYNSIFALPDGTPGSCKADRDRGI